MRTLLVAALCLTFPAAALGAEGDAAAPIEDRAAQKLNEVEHGLYFDVEAGGLFLFSPKNSGSGGFSPGRTFLVTAGGEIGDIVSLALMVMGTTVTTPAGFKSDGTDGLSGDFSSMTLGGMAKISFVGFSDSNNIKRLYLYARIAGGYSLVTPKGFYDGGDIALFGGLGLEYFTHLRHFSLGLTVDFFYGVKHMGAGLMLTPNLRYTF
jgi:hypothetical protein